MNADRVDIVASGAVVLGGVALTLIHNFGGSDGDPEGWFSALGFAAPFIGAGLIALVGTLRGRPNLMFVTGVALIPMSVLSVVLLPLVVPAVLLIVHSTPKRLDPRDLIAPSILASVLIVGLAIVVFHQDPATWSTPEGSGSSSNIITTLEATVVVSATVAVVLIAAFAPVPQRH